ncbi:MAG: Uma2 family endonuclease [Lachnospiraceae bacterium]|nr:Uma2 family endonuclease [Lachnospiraceae bacterium]
MTIDEMIARKKEYGYTCEYISEKSGVPVSTVRKIFSKNTPAPRMGTLEALRRFFIDSSNNSNNKSYIMEDDHDISFVNESAADHYATNGTSAIKIEGYNNKTIDDYLALPEGVRVELIDGVFYDMAAPTSIHQSLIGNVYTQLQQFIDSNNGACIPFIAPTDVQLDCDDKTVVEPDVMVVCDRNKITKPRIVGAPDLVVEVLSDSNWYHDTHRKLWKYKKAGVREYWIVMPNSLKILVYCFEKTDFPTEYSFDDVIPVGIWDGKCKVDFKKIYDKISFML